MRLFARFVSVAALMLILGCGATLTKQGRSVKISDAAGVTGCKYLDDITKSSSIAGLRIDAGIKSARIQVRNRAAELGATHVVWSNVNAGFYSGAVATGKVFKCY